MEMTPQKLDFYFPFVVFFYGFLILFVIETPWFQKNLESVGGELWRRITQRRELAWVSFFAGGLWSLQNLFFS